MKLTVQQLHAIEEYVDASLIDTGKLITYLEKHKTVKNDIFAPCSKLPKKKLFTEAYCTALDHDYAFRPVSRDVFLRRVPFYFYLSPSSTGESRHSPLWNILPHDRKNPLSDEALESIYTDLEYMYYELQIPLKVIFGYIHSQLVTPKPPRKKPTRTSDNFAATISYTSELLAESITGEKSDLSSREVFTWWRHYLHLCKDLGWTDYTPERFISAYNYALEASGQAPIIYHPILQMGFLTFTSDRNTFVFKGNFPCDDNGNPILRWTTLKVTDPERVSFNAEKSRFGELTIVASPRSMIYERGVVYDEEDRIGFDLDDLEWVRIYAGPQKMTFNKKSLKEFREACHLTQKQLAEAIDVSVRTYQKWEAGTTMPDCHNLIRIMNWLGIHDAQELITYDE